MQEYLDKHGSVLRKGDDVSFEVAGSKEVARGTILKFYPIRYTMQVGYKNSQGTAQKQTVFTEHCVKLAGASDV